MFFNFDVLCRKSNYNFSLVWLIATRGISKVSKDELTRAEVEHYCNSLENAVCTHSQRSSDRFSLRLASRLLFGIVVLHNYQVNIFYDELHFDFINFNVPKKPKGPRKKTATPKKRDLRDIPTIREQSTPLLRINDQEGQVRSFYIEELDKHPITTSTPFKLPVVPEDRSLLHEQPEITLPQEAPLSLPDVQPIVPDIPTEPATLPREEPPSIHPEVLDIQQQIEVIQPDAKRARLSRRLSSSSQDSQTNKPKKSRIHIASRKRKINLTIPKDRDEIFTIEDVLFGTKDVFLDPWAENQMIEDENVVRRDGSSSLLTSHDTPLIHEQSKKSSLGKGTPKITTPQGVSPIQAPFKQQPLDMQLHTVMEEVAIQPTLLGSVEQEATIIEDHSINERQRTSLRQGPKYSEIMKNIIRTVTNWEFSNNEVPLEFICPAPIRRRQIALTFSAVLQQQKQGNVTMIKQEDSLMLKAVRRN